MWLAMYRYKIYHKAKPDGLHMKSSSCNYDV